MILETYKLASINGGNATLFNAFARILKTVYDIGYQVGSTIKRLFNGKLCKI